MTFSINAVQESFEKKIWLRVLVLLIIGLVVTAIILPNDLRSTILITSGKYALATFFTALILMAMPFFVGAIVGWLFYSKKVYAFGFFCMLICQVFIHGHTILQPCTRCFGNFAGDILR